MEPERRYWHSLRNQRPTQGVVFGIGILKHVRGMTLWATSKPKPDAAVPSGPSTSSSSHHAGRPEAGKRAGPPDFGSPDLGMV